MTDFSKLTASTIDKNWQPAVASHFRLQWEDAQQAYVLLYPEGMIKLNPSGGEILSRCTGQQTVSQIIDELRSKFPDAPSIEPDVLEFLSIAYQHDWLTHE